MAIFDKMTPEETDFERKTAQKQFWYTTISCGLSCYTKFINSKCGAQGLLGEGGPLRTFSFVQSLNVRNLLSDWSMSKQILVRASTNRQTKKQQQLHCNGASPALYPVRVLFVLEILSSRVDWFREISNLLSHFCHIIVFWMTEKVIV